MSELDLQEAFRQLALDLDAVRDDDPELREFEIERNGKEVHVEFRAYKASLEIRVSNPERKKRPMATLHPTNAFDRLGRSMDIDEKPEVDDEKFLERFDLVTEAPKEAIAAMLSSRAAREASFELEKAGALPVWINGQSVGMSADAGVKDLAHERIAKIIEALCHFEDALGTWDEAADRSPIREGGRRVIRKTPRSSSWSWLTPILDWSPAIALPVTLFSAIPYSALDGYLLDSKLSVLVAIAGAVSVVTCLVSIRALKGTRNAFLRAIGRTIGVSAIVSQIVFLVLHVYNRGPSPSHVESVTVLAVQPSKKTQGTTEFRRAGDPRIHTIPTLSRSSVRGKSFRLIVHDGRLGWGWVEYAD